MLLDEKYILIEVIKKMPKYGISYRRFEYENKGVITEKSLQNYVRGKSNMTNTKYELILETLKNRYKYEYRCIMAEILKEHNVESIDKLLEKLSYERFNNILAF